MTEHVIDTEIAIVGAGGCGLTAALTAAKQDIFLIQHELGTKWSVFTEQLLTQIFRSFMPEKELKFQTTDSTVIMSVELGSDFNEHDYHD